MPEILIETTGTTLILSLNRPEKRNALNDELIGALKDALREAEANDALTAIVIRGEGKDFCSGADLSALQKIAESNYEENLEDARSLVELFTTIRRMHVPVVAAVHGRALAGGCGLATACDLVVASRTARFGYPEVKIGFVPAIVMAFLRRNLSEKRAFELATQGFEFSAERAFEMGLVNRLVDEESELETAVMEYVSVYSKVSRSAVRLSKKLFYDMDALSFDDAAELGARVNAEARMTDDCKNGIRGFLNKTTAGKD
jgi:methylglutaconyl-CoA hydratase